MRKILVTGGTVFVSRSIAEYFAARNEDVFVLNRNTRTQPEGVTLIEADRNDLGDVLKGMRFDAVIDVTAYNAADIAHLTDALDSCRDYIMISSSAVYPETGEQPFRENAPTGPNRYWGAYGTDKIAAEKLLLERYPDAYILRPPYLYGPLNNVYREAFVFECAEQGRPFYLPRNGEMKLQFFHIRDLCRLIEIILDTHPQVHIINTGNPESVSVREWTDLCYEILGATPKYINVFDEPDQRKYFSFHDYEYALDVTVQSSILPDLIPLREGLKESWEWYRDHRDEVRKKPFFEYIDTHMTE